MPLYDPVAIAAALHPEWFEFTPARVDVECNGRFTRGMTVCEFRLNHPRHAHKKQNASVATKVQADKVKSWILGSIAAYVEALDDAQQ
jgi:purine nucleosidase